MNSLLLNDQVGNLTLDDIEVLNMLTSQDSLNKFSAMSKQQILTNSNLTESRLRKSILKLEATCFIKTSTEYRKQVLYVTEHGLNAIQLISERGNV